MKIENTTNTKNNQSIINPRIRSPDPKLYLIFII